MAEPVKQQKGFALVENRQHINIAGRPKLDPNDVLNRKTNRQLREAELVSLLRKLKPHQSKAILSATAIIDNSEAKDNDKLKASALILSTYRGLLMDLYSHADEDEGIEIQSQSPKFSLQMVPPIS